jgi:hypothetical protein
VREQVEAGAAARSSEDDGRAVESETGGPHTGGGRSGDREGLGGWGEDVCDDEGVPGDGEHNEKRGGPQLNRGGSQGCQQRAIFGKSQGGEAQGAVAGSADASPGAAALGPEPERILHWSVRRRDEEVTGAGQGAHAAAGVRQGYTGLDGGRAGAVACRDEGQAVVVAVHGAVNCGDQVTGGGEVENRWRGDVGDAPVGGA